jgi:hypothetical protein
MQLKLLQSLILAFAMCLPAIASADLASVWFAGKGAHIQGTGTVFENVEPGMAFGVEAGAEILNLEVMAEAFILGKDQYMFTGNFGMDFSFELGVRLSVGGYLGVILFKMPEPEEQGLTLPSDLRASLGPMLAGVVEANFSGQYADQASELGQWAAGVGPRVRIQLDKSIVPTVYIGVEASMGYHFMFSGDDVVGEAKNRAIDQTIDEANKDIEVISDELAGQLRNAVGAKPIDPKDLNGTNYNFGVFLKIDL